MPLVSVIMPVYNRSFCVVDGINSVLDQTHREVECIVVDDGSTDGSLAVVSDAFANEPRVRAVAQAHGGVSAARNLGLREMRGEFVTFLDSDDLMPPSRIRRQLDLLVEQSCDAVLGFAESFAMPGVEAPAWFEARPEWQRGYDWNTFLIASDLLRSVGDFDETLAMGEDIDLLVRLRLAGVRISAVDETFNLRRFFGDNLTYAIDEGDSSLRDAIRRQVGRRRNRSE
jgi:glycosyltransferase involved in cell wall biosynthesis